jgi:ubiquinone/menaquinone biosynthesis C-methylase UbiE
MINRRELMSTNSLEEAIKLLFNINFNGRIDIITQEAMIGQVALEYDELGKNARAETYQKIVEDFKNRTGCYGVNHPREGMNVGTILEVGCGSGLLTLQLAEQTNSDRIIGIDISEEMIKLASGNLVRYTQRKREKIKEFWSRLPEYLKPKVEEEDKLEQNTLLANRINFIIGNIYDLERYASQRINYIVCRNVLHRLKEPEKALIQMYKLLSPKGKIYIRDLRRDANWKIILERIGEKRWQTHTLVGDYVKAMASMLTVSELKSILKSAGICKYEITNGEYIGCEIKATDNIKEYETETEYVCVIEK